MAKKNRVPGTFQTRIREERPTYPTPPFGADDVPTGFTTGGADAEQMTATGFPRDTSGMTLVDQHGNEIDGSLLHFRVLRDQHGEIVATWDEGRWWTPYESARYIQDYVSGREELLR